MNCPICFERWGMKIEMEPVDRVSYRCMSCGTEVVDHRREKLAIRTTAERLENYPANKVLLDTLPPSHSLDIVLQTGMEEGPKGSIQESWVERYEREMWEVAIIEGVMTLLIEPDRKLVQQVWFERKDRDSICEELHLSESVFYERRKELLRKFATAFGLL